MPVKCSGVPSACGDQSSTERLVTPHVQRERGKVIDRGVHIIGKRAKRARHSQVCSIENRIYIAYYTSKSGIWLVIS